MTIYETEGQDGKRYIVDTATGLRAEVLSVDGQRVQGDWFRPASNPDPFTDALVTSGLIAHDSSVAAQTGAPLAGALNPGGGEYVPPSALGQVDPDELDFPFPELNDGGRFVNRDLPDLEGEGPLMPGQNYAEGWGTPNPDFGDWSGFGDGDWEPNVEGWTNVPWADIAPDRSKLQPGGGGFFGGVMDFLNEYVFKGIPGIPGTGWIPGIPDVTDPVKPPDVTAPVDAIGEIAGEIAPLLLVMAMSRDEE